ncbi:MAG: beta-lactamase domain protein, partial [Rhizobacter sp.]|nr:beta-lactamase domain protein [Rhizobacter sp.]
MRIQLGDAVVTRIEDYQGPGFAPEEMFTNYESGQWESQREWLVPGFYDPMANQVRTSFHSWLVRTPHHTILID